MVLGGGKPGDPRAGEVGSDMLSGREPGLTLGELMDVKLPVVPIEGRLCIPISTGAIDSTSSDTV